MKNNKHLFVIASLTAVLSLNVSLYVCLNKKALEVEAYNTASLPTTINLNDCSEQEIRFYYSGLNSLDVSEREGTNLLKNLKPILMNNQKYCNYDSGDNVWKIYEISDRDWVKSPASAITHGAYNSNTNTITNYQYGSDGDNPYLHALYIDRDIDNQTRAWGNHNQDGWGINREHIWAKSHGFQADGAGGARGDPMHLWAANGYANNIHSNYFFAFVDKTRTYTNCGSTYSSVKNNLRGYSKNYGGNETVFEPQDCDKGDIARAIFYMVARYNNYAGNDNSIDTNNPNLVLLNDLSENGRTGTSTSNDAYGMGLLSDLLAWNKLDPVDEYEIHRNNLLYRNYTNNRNPFIDFPSWADAIWGTADLDGTNYNSSITTNASPSTDPISSNSSAFEISSTALDLQVGEEVEIYGRNAESTISWTVGNNSVVSLDKNSTSNNEIVTVTALASGTTTITATSGGHSVSCSVEVTNYGTRSHPLTIAQAKQLIDDNNGNETPKKLCVKGIVTSSTYNETYNNFDNVWLQSDDGNTERAFDLYRVRLDNSIEGDYTAADALKGYEVIAEGYAKKYNTTYELAPKTVNASTVSPYIISIATPQPVEKTPRELVEEKTTNTILAYRYNKEVDESGVTDTLTRDFTSVANGSTTYTDWDSKVGTSGVVYAGQSAGGNNAIQLRTTNNNSGVVVTGNSTGKTASSITVSWNSNTANARTLNVYGKDSAYSAPTDLYNANNQGTLLGTIVYGTSTSLTITGSYEYIGFKSNSGALWLDSVDIQWGGEATTYTYSDISIRFGGLLSKTLWDELDTNEHVISGFGVMITAYDQNAVATYSIKDNLSNAVLAEQSPNIDTKIVNYYMSKADMAVPPESGDDYAWNLFHRVDSSDIAKYFTAAAYIKVGDEYVFFRQVHFSVKTLAQDYLTNRDYSSSTADGSLADLAN